MFITCVLRSALVKFICYMDGRTVVSRLIPCWPSFIVPRLSAMLQILGLHFTKSGASLWLTYRYPVHVSYEISI